MPAKKEINLNMRSQPDFWFRSIENFKNVASVLLVLAVILLGLAAPAVKGLLNQVLNLNLDTTWNRFLLTIDFYLFGLTFLVGLVGTFINLTRNRRRNDRLSLILIGASVISLVYLAVYLIVQGL
ncbi:MAG TPA: hypothetical protein VF531_04365 [Bacillota bacterium]